MVLSCNKNQIEKSDIVTFHYSEIQGKYILHYQLIVMHHDLNLAPEIKNLQDTFLCKISNDKSKLEWRSVSSGKSFEFDADINQIIMENSGYKIARLPIFSNKVTYKGSYDTVTLNKNWVLYAMNNRDEFAEFVKKEGVIFLQGTDVDFNMQKAHLAASSQRLFYKERHLRFKIVSSKKIE